jgi:hypothetical protein
MPTMCALMPRTKVTRVSERRFESVKVFSSYATTELSHKPGFDGIASRIHPSSAHEPNGRQVLQRRPAPARNKPVVEVGGVKRVRLRVKLRRLDRPQRQQQFDHSPLLQAPKIGVH